MTWIEMSRSGVGAIQLGIGLYRDYSPGSLAHVLRGECKFGLNLPRWFTRTGKVLNHQKVPQEPLLIQDYPLFYPHQGPFIAEHYLDIDIDICRYRDIQRYIQIQIYVDIDISPGSVRSAKRLAIGLVPWALKQPVSEKCQDQRGVTRSKTPILPTYVPCSGQRESIIDSAKPSGTKCPLVSSRC